MVAAMLKYASPVAYGAPTMNDARMSARFCISTASPDREDDVVLQEGLDWTDYQKNAVILLNHSQADLPVAMSQTPDGHSTIEPMPKIGKTYATAWFHRSTVLGNQTYELVRLGVLKAASIGFMVNKAEARGRAKNANGRPPLLIVRASPLEWSICTVPAQPEAVRDQGDMVREQLSRSLVAGSPLHPHLRKSLEPLASNAVVWSLGFDPSEPRDEDGKWTTGGSGLSAEPVFGETANQQAKNKQLDRIDGWLENIKLFDSDKANQYASDAKHVISNMPNGSVERFSRYVQTISFRSHTSTLTKEMNDRRTAKDGPRFIGQCGGWFDPDKGEIAVDGGTTNASAKDIYAHEFAHAVDGPTYRMSRDKDWHSAWKQEIATPDFPLSKYGASDPAEGFAEFGRLLFTGKYHEAKTMFPKCYAFWKSQGIA